LNRAPSSITRHLSAFFDTDLNLIEWLRRLTPIRRRASYGLLKFTEFIRWTRARARLGLDDDAGVDGAARRGRPAACSDERRLSARMELASPSAAESGSTRRSAA